MPPTTLLDNISTDYLAAMSALSPQNTPQRVLVYVESDEDIAFWRNILSPFEGNKVRFDIQLPIRDIDTDNSHYYLSKGKLAVLKFVNNTGKNLILCVDSDYDYLLQNKTDVSKKINTNPYIFQTYAYAIENLMCYAPNLHSICVQATTNDTRLVDFVQILESYSEIIYPLFLWSVYFTMNEDTESFTINNLSEIIKITDSPSVENQFNSSLENLKNRVDAKIQELKNVASEKVNEISALGISLTELGITPPQTYLFVRGHTIKDSVVLMFLEPIYEQLKNKKYEQINEIQDAIHKENSRNQYKKIIKTITLKAALSMNTRFQSCFLYQKIHSDLDKYIQQL